MEVLDDFTVYVPLYDPTTKEESIDITVEIPIQIRVGDEIGRIVWDIEKLYLTNISISSVARVASVLHSRLPDSIRGSTEWILTRRQAMRSSGIYLFIFDNIDIYVSGRL